MSLEGYILCFGFYKEAFGYRHMNNFRLLLALLNICNIFRGNYNDLETQFQWVAFLFDIREAPGSDIGPETNYIDRGLSWFFLSYSRKMPV
jgi:hypothetical protein